MDDRLIAMLQGAKSVMNRVDEKEGVTHTPTSNATGEKIMPTYNGVDGSQLLESVPNGAQYGGQHVAQPMGQGGPNEYAPRPVSNTNPIQQTYKNLHTSKMPDAIKNAINLKAELPKELVYILSEKENYDIIDNNVDKVKQHIKERI